MQCYSVDQRVSYSDYVINNLLISTIIFLMILLHLNLANHVTMTYYLIKNLFLSKFMVTVY